MQWYKKTQQRIEPVVVVGEPEPPRQELADQKCTTTSEPETYYSICITTSQGIDTMNRDELVSQIRFLLKLQEDKDAIIDRQQESLDEMKADLKEARKDNKALQKQLAESSKKQDAALASIE